MPRSGAVQGVVNLDFPGIQNYETLGIFFGNIKQKKKRFTSTNIKKRE
jgi:hypothetical protein